MVVVPLFSYNQRNINQSVFAFPSLWQALSKKMEITIVLIRIFRLSMMKISVNVGTERYLRTKFILFSRLVITGLNTARNQCHCANPR